MIWHSFPSLSWRTIARKSTRGAHKCLHLLHVLVPISHVYISCIYQVRTETACFSRGTFDTARFSHLLFVCRLRHCSQVYGKQTQAKQILGQVPRFSLERFCVFRPTHQCSVHSYTYRDRHYTLTEDPVIFFPWLLCHWYSVYAFVSRSYWLIFAVKPLQTLWRFVNASRRKSTSASQTCYFKWQRRCCAEVHVVCLMLSFRPTIPSVSRWRNGSIKVCDWCNETRS